MVSKSLEYLKACCVPEGEGDIKRLIAEELVETSMLSCSAV